MYKIFLTLFLLFLFSCQPDSKEISTRKVLSKKGMVVCANPIAAQVGANILEMGGNAFDAAIAVQFTLAVVYPRAGNIGGGGFMVYDSKSEGVGSLDFREVAPMAAQENMYLDSLGNVIKDQSIKGVKAAGVPGVVAGMLRIHDKFGSLPWEQLLQTAITLADSGFALSEDQSQKLNQHRENFIAYNPYPIPFLKSDSSLWEKDDWIVQKDLAKTLKLIAKNKAAGFYTGSVADILINTMKTQKGIITLKDLETYQALWRKPVKTNFLGYTLYSMPPPSSGGIALIQLLKGSLNNNFDKNDPKSIKTIHYIIELTRRVYADRATYLGDNDFYHVPIEELISDTYLENRYKNIDLSQKTNSQTIKAGEVSKIEHFETTHFSIADKMGNAVAITTTLNGNYGCKVWVKDAGFFLNNEMDDFSVKPGIPNQFGLVGAEANKIEPKKRMLSSMTPSLILKNDELVMLVGCNGGSTIITSVYQVIMNTLYYGIDIQQAVNLPRMHAQWLPDKVFIENGFLPIKSLEMLKSMGHEFDTVPQFGKVNAILKLPDGNFQGASDYTRGDDIAIAVDDDLEK